jgi:hypothetical protein
VDSSPVHVRPTLARGGSSQRKVPPINKTELAVWTDPSPSPRVKGAVNDVTSREETEEVCVCVLLYLIRNYIHPQSVVLPLFVKFQLNFITKFGLLIANAIYPRADEELAEADSKQRVKEESGQVV